MTGVHEKRLTPLMIANQGSIEKRAGIYILKCMLWLKDRLEMCGLCQREFKLLEYLNEKIKVTEYHARKLSKLIEGRQYLEMSPSGLLNYSLLLQDGLSALFITKGLEEGLSDRNNLNEAVRALAYDTASAMISLIAVEGAIREPYKDLEGQECKIVWKDSPNEVERELKYESF